MSENLLLNKSLDIYSSNRKIGTTTRLTDSDSLSTSESPSQYRSYQYSFSDPVEIEEIYIRGSGYHHNYKVYFYRNQDFTNLIATYSHSSGNANKRVRFPVSEVGSVKLHYNSSNGTTLYTFFLYGSHPINKFLIQEGEEIKTYKSGSWNVVGLTPVTMDMFNSYGMDKVTEVPDSEWKYSMKILHWSNNSRRKKAAITTPVSRYNDSLKLYKGQGVIETETEILPDGRTTLFIYAEYDNCTFEFSLDNGITWHECELNKVIDISEIEGNELKIRVHLPTKSATLSALSYTWA